MNPLCRAKEIERLSRKYVARGMSAEAAHQKARKAFVGLDLVAAISLSAVLAGQGTIDKLVRSLTCTEPKEAP